jgi:hypothetical protein
VLLFAGVQLLPVFMPGLSGTLGTAPWYLADLGVLPAGDLLLEPNLAHGFADPGSVLPLYTQLGLINAGTKLLSPPSLYLVADKDLWDDVGCP